MRAAVLLICVVSAACGGSGPLVAPAPVTRSVTFVTFLDENRNGTLDPVEAIRIPNVEVTFAGVSGRSAASGEVSLVVPVVSSSLGVTESSLPPFYQPPRNLTATAPAAGSVPVPVTLPVGEGATPGVYLAFGDSITNGRADVGDGQGYTGLLERKLAAHFGRARVINDGVDSSNTERGDARISDSLEGGRPAFTLILYGTNDWADDRCTQTPPCFTIDRLRSMVQKVKSRGGFPFVATLLMTNVGNDYRASPQRNSWVEAQNGYIRDMAAQEDAVLVDLHAAFARSPLAYADLFFDYIHPSAQGYQTIADTWFEAIVRRR